MPEPREYLIVKNLQAALLGIVVAAGYHYSLATLAVKLDPNQKVEDLLGASAKRPFYILEVTPDEWVYHPSMLVTVTLPVTIHAIHDSDPLDDDSWLLVYQRLCADIEQAIGADIQRDGLAIDTRIETREFQSFGGSQVWAMVKTKIAVRRTYGNPNG